MTDPTLMASGVSGWQPIATAPRDGTVILLFGWDEDTWNDHDEPDELGERSVWPARFSFQGIWWIDGGMMRRVVRPTHWMPLPSPPGVSA